MPVPIGVGAGDLIAVTKLTKKLALELRKTGAAGPEYQALLVELEALDRALSSINDLKPVIRGPSRLEALRAAVMICQRQLQDFLDEMSKFDKTLGSEGGRGRSLKHLGRRVQWTTAFSEDVKNLRATLDLQLMIINILMSLQLLDSSNNAEIDRNIIIQTSRGLSQDSQKLREIVEQQRQETLVHHEAQYRTLDANLRYTRNIHAEVHNAKPKIDDLLSQVNEILKAGPVKHNPPTASSRLRETVMTAAATAGLLRIFANTRNTMDGRIAGHSGVRYPRINHTDVPDQALSSSRWVWDNVPDDGLTLSTVRQHLQTVFLSRLIIHVESCHDRIRFWIPRPLSEDEKYDLIEQGRMQSTRDSQESDSDDTDMDTDTDSNQSDTSSRHGDLDSGEETSDSENPGTDSEGQDSCPEDHGFQMARLKTRRRRSTFRSRSSSIKLAISILKLGQDMIGDAMDYW